MKDFSEWLLLERQLDQSMRSAAAKTFDALDEKLLMLVKEAPKRFADDLVARLAWKTLSPKFAHFDMQSHDTAAQIIVKMLDSRNYMNYGSLGMHVYSKMYGESSGRHIAMDLQLPTSMISIPPSISKDMLNASMFGTARNPFRVFITGSSGTQGGSRLAGAYTTSRPQKSPSGGTIIQLEPGIIVINLFDFDSLKYRRAPGSSHGTLYTAIDNALRIVVKGEGDPQKVNQGEIQKAMEPWVNQFEKELMNARSTFVHEFIHFLDDMRYKNKSPGWPGNIGAGIDSSADPADTKKKAYYTSDSEWNAFFQAAAEQVEDALLSYLVANTSDRTANFIIRSSQQKNLFNTLPNNAKCKELAKYVVDEFNERINGISNHVSITNTLKELGLQSLPFKGLHRFCLFYVVTHANRTSNFFLADPKKRMKLLNRISSLAEDIVNGVKAYQRRMAAGAVPTEYEHAAARRKFVAAGSHPYRLEGTSQFFPPSPYRAMITADALQSGSRFSAKTIGKSRFDPNKTYLPL
jgi:hypothetical protein